MSSEEQDSKQPQPQPQQEQDSPAAAADAPRRNSASEEHFVAELLGDNEMVNILRTADGGVVGLSNIGNTCYLNAGLQALLNCTPLVRAFARRIPGVTENSTAGHFTTLVRKYWSGSFAVLNPSDVLRDVWRINSSFQGFNQQDSQEFVRTYLDALHEATKRERPKPPPERSPVSSSSGATPSSPPPDKPVAAPREDDDASRSPPQDDASRSPPQDEASRSPPIANGISPSSSSSSPSESPRPSPSERAADDEDADGDGDASRRRVPSTSNDEGVASSNGRQSSKTLPLPDRRNSKSKPRSQSQSFDDTDKPSEKDASTNGAAGSNNISSSNDSNSNSSSNSNPAPKPPAARRKPRNYGSAVSDLFGGQLHSEVTCLECKSVSRSNQGFYDLSLEIPNQYRLKELDTSKVPPSDASRSWFFSLTDSIGITSRTVSLSTCLHSFFTNENLENVDQYKCDACKTKVDASKCLSLSRIPEILVLHVKRFHHGYWSSKLTNPVEFPPTLDMRPFVTESKLKDKCNAVTDYSLFAVVSHKGGYGGGHYVSYAKHPETERWYEYDDRVVSKITEEKVLSRQAYSIFYRRNQAGRHDPFVASAFKLQELLPGVPKCLVSKSWLHKVDTFSYPGPLDNSELCCPHGVPKPLDHPDRRDRAVEISDVGWDLLFSKYGGGPHIDTTTVPPSCAECVENRLDRIRQHERQRILELDHSVEPDNSDWFLMSEQWLTRWRNFIRRKTNTRPGPITNSDLLDPDTGDPIPDLRPSYDYRGVSRGVWLELHKLYGGGPPIHRATIELYGTPLPLTAEDYAPARRPRALQTSPNSEVQDQSTRQTLSPEDNPGAPVSAGAANSNSISPRSTAAAARHSPAAPRSTRTSAVARRGRRTSTGSPRPHMAVLHR